MPLHELVRYWKWKEKDSAVDITEHIQTMQANMEIVREMAQESERKGKSLPKKSQQEAHPETLKLEILYLSSDHEKRTNFRTSGRGHS